MKVSNTDQVIGLVKQNAHDSRLFALGIGAASSRHLVEGIASAGGGTCAFVEGDESIQKATLSQLKNALQPSLTGKKMKFCKIQFFILIHIFIRCQGGMDWNPDSSTDRAEHEQIFNWI